MLRTISTTNAIHRGRWLILLAATLWGTVGVSTKELFNISATNPLSVGFFRLAFAAPLIACLCWFTLRKRMFAIHRRDLLIMALLGMMLALYQVCYFAAIARVGVAIAALVTLCTAPVLVALLSVFFLRERMNRTVGLALIFAIIGTLLLVDLRSEIGKPGTDLIGIVFALGSALGYAIIALAGRAVSGRYESLQINAVGFATGAAILLPFALLTGFTISYPPVGWLLLGYLGIVPTALAYGLFVTGMRSTPATVASIITLIEPFTASLLAWLLFGERLGALGVLGACFLLGAILLLTRAKE